jgi:hypothetical protein
MAGGTIHFNMGAGVVQMSQTVKNNIETFELGPEWASVPIESKDSFPVVVRLDGIGEERNLLLSILKSGHAARGTMDTPLI